MENEHSLIVKIKKSEEVVSNISEEISSILTTELADKHFTLESQSEIGSSVSSVLRDKAGMAILISLVGVIIYLPSVLISALVWQPPSPPFMISFSSFSGSAGFSISRSLCSSLPPCSPLGATLNDSVIVFDRIRENMAKDRTHTLLSQINDSVNQVVEEPLLPDLLPL